MNANRFSIFLNILFRVKQKTVVTLKVLMASKNIPFFFLRSHYLGASLDYYHKEYGRGKGTRVGRKVQHLVLLKSRGEKKKKKHLPINKVFRICTQSKCNSRFCNIY